MAFLDRHAATLGRNRNGGLAHLREQDLVDVICGEIVLRGKSLEEARPAFFVDFWRIGLYQPYLGAPCLDRGFAGRFEGAAGKNAPVGVIGPVGLQRGTDKALQFQVFGTSLWKPSDLHVLSLRYEKSESSTGESASLSSRMPIGSQWRIGPRLRLDRIKYLIDDTTQLTLSPSLRLELLRSRTQFEFEAGSDFGSRDIPLDKQKTNSYYFSLGYRLGF